VTTGRASDAKQVKKLELRAIVHHLLQTILSYLTSVLEGFLVLEITDEKTNYETKKTTPPPKRAFIEAPVFHT